RDGACLHPVRGAATMPLAYLEAIGGFVIGHDSLACGLGVPTGRSVVTPDVFEEPLWQPYLDLAARYGFRGCWSFPIKTRDNTAVGTFAMYFPGPREARPQDLALADAVTQAAAIVIAHDTEAQERSRAEQAIAADLRDMQVLHDVGTRLVAIDDPRLLYDAILAAAIELTHADAGTLQTFDAAADELVLGAARGFDDVMTAHFRRVRAERGTACGAALCTPAR